MTKQTAKKPSKKEIFESVWPGPNSPIGDWSVEYGKLIPGQGRPPTKSRLFQFVCEKIPLDALDAVRSHFLLDRTPDQAQGVYMVHDSMGAVRYVGRGKVFYRLKACKKAHPHELVYFSIFIVENKQHEREIETLLIRAAGPQLEFNDKKKRIGIETGNIRDFEPGTMFYERRKKKEVGQRGSDAEVAAQRC